jgi:hypothetical protein
MSNKGFDNLFDDEAEVVEVKKEVKKVEKPKIVEIEKEKGKIPKDKPKKQIEKKKATTETKEKTIITKEDFSNVDKFFDKVAHSTDFQELTYLLITGKTHRGTQKHLKSKLSQYFKIRDDREQYIKNKLKNLDNLK